MPETNEAAVAQTKAVIEKVRGELLSQSQSVDTKIAVAPDAPLETYSFQKAAAEVRADSGAALAGNPATYEYQQKHKAEEAERLKLERAIYGNMGAASMPVAESPPKKVK